MSERSVASVHQGERHGDMPRAKQAQTLTARASDVQNSMESVVHDERFQFTPRGLWTPELRLCSHEAQLLWCGHVSVVATFRCRSLHQRMHAKHTLLYI